MSKILVFGAHGRTGKQFAALQDQKDLIEYPGDILDSQLVDSYVSQADVIVSLVGHVKGSKPLMQTHGIQNIIEAMQKHGKRRIISLTGSGVRCTGDTIPLWDYVLNIGILIIDKKRVEDGRGHVSALQASNLDWTVLRVLKLRNGIARHNWKLTQHGPVQLLSTRADVALAIDQILKDNSFIGQMPLMTSK